MEYEVRYFFNTSKKDDIINKLKNIDGVIMKKRSYEKTIQLIIQVVIIVFIQKKLMVDLE